MAIWKVPLEGNENDRRSVQKKKKTSLCLTPPLPQKTLEKQRGAGKRGRNETGQAGSLK